jgi:hypothetical protein
MPVNPDHRHLHLSAHFGLVLAARGLEDIDEVRF